MNFLVHGCGRSGTSLLCSMFHRAGFYVGRSIHPTRDSNPAGFFESAEINHINNGILEQYTSTLDATGWLGIYEEPIDPNRLPHDTPARISEETRHMPFCFKDPRFSYTMPVWAPHLSAFTALCVFREPAPVVHSMMKECSSYYPLCRMTPEKAQRIWRANYTNVFERLEPRFPVLYVAYEDILSGRAVAALNERLGLSLDSGLARMELNRSRFAALSLERPTLDVFFDLLEKRL